MKLDWLSQKKFFTFLPLLGMLISAACAPAVLPTSKPTVEIVKAVSATNTQASEKLPASPTRPPETSTKTALAPSKAVSVSSPSTTPEPTSVTVSDPFASAPAVEAYCLPKDMSVVNFNEPLSPPPAAKKAIITADGLEMNGLPSNGCVFYYTFTGPVPEGMKLEVSEPNQSKPFLTAKLVPVDGSPEIVWVLIRHGMVLSPRAAFLSVNFVVRGPDSQALRSDVVNMHSSLEETSSPDQAADDNDDEEENCGCDAPILP